MDKTKCPHCDATISKPNINRHIRKIHYALFQKHYSAGAASIGTAADNSHQGVEEITTPPTSTTRELHIQQDEDDSKSSDDDEVLNTLYQQKQQVLMKIEEKEKLELIDVLENDVEDLQRKLKQSEEQYAKLLQDNQDYTKEKLKLRSQLVKQQRELERRLERLEEGEDVTDDDNFTLEPTDPVQAFTAIPPKLSELVTIKTEPSALNSDVTLPDNVQIQPESKESFLVQNTSPVLNKIQDQPSTVSTNTVLAPDPSVIEAWNDRAERCYDVFENLQDIMSKIPVSHSDEEKDSDVSKIQRAFLFLMLRYEIGELFSRCLSSSRRSTDNLADNLEYVLRCLQERQGEALAEVTGGKIRYSSAVFYLTSFCQQFRKLRMTCTVKAVESVLCGFMTETTAAYNKQIG